MSDESSAPDAIIPTGDDYVVVARRYRPQGFDELIGQEHVARALKQAILTGRVGHAYLFTGARGVGKTSAARILAKALNCVEGPTATPCGQCDVCQGVASGDDVDVIEIDGASNRGIDEIRQLRQNVAVRPSRARFKVYIIDEVHMLTKEAFNALLKTLEEPPEHVKFIFATTEANKIPITILSRCQRFDFAGIAASSIQQRLAQIAAAEGVEIDAEALQILAIRAAGSMRDSQSLLEQLLATADGKISAEDVNQLLGIASSQRIGELAARLVDRDAAGALAEFDGALASGADEGQLIDQLMGYVRDLMALGVGCKADQLLYVLPAQVELAKELGQRLGVATILAMLQVLDQTAARMRVSVHGRTLAEMALVRVCSLQDLDGLADAVATVRGGGSIVIGAASLPSTVAKPQAAGEVKKNSEPVVTAAANAANVSPATIPQIPNPQSQILSDALATEWWQSAATRAGGLLSDLVAQTVEVRATNGDRMLIRVDRPMTKQLCEQPTQRSELESLVATYSGRRISLQFEVAEGVVPPVVVAPPPRSRRQMQEEVAAQPFVKKALELFGVDSDAIRYLPPKEEE